MTRYPSYILCTSPRSGSTLLCKLLAATGKSGKPDSHFHSPSITDWMRYYGISSGEFSNDLDLLTAIFQAARERGTGDTGIFGLRLQQHSFEFFMRQLQILCADSPAHSDVARIEGVFGNTLFIHLTRENKLEQAISLVKAKQTGLWHKAPDGTELERASAPQEPFYDSDAIAHHLSELTNMEASWISWFAEQDLKPLRITYDDLSAEPAEVTTKILGCLGVNQLVTPSIDLPVAKLADVTSTLWAKRFLSEHRC